MASTGPDRHTVMAVLDRDGYQCVICGKAAEGERGVNWVLHHRRPRAMGGTSRADKNSPANLLTLCSPCHVEIESRRQWAVDNGWIVHQAFDPAAVAVSVQRRNRFVYLTADGTYEEAA